jgi:hypothetical protein
VGIQTCIEETSEGGDAEDFIYWQRDVLWMPACAGMTWWLRWLATLTNSPPHMLAARPGMVLGPLSEQHDYVGKDMAEVVEQVLGTTTRAAAHDLG